MSSPPFARVLVANRGEIACRIITTLHRLGCEAVAVYAEADRHARHVLDADHAVLLGPAPPAESYLRIDRIVEAARRTGATAIHPGYGLLSEQVGFAEACEAAGITFIGPTPEQLRIFGHKHTAREHALAAGVPLAAGSGLLADLDEAVAAAASIGYPVMVKASGGGGGIGMRACADESALREAFAAVSRLAEANFGGGGVFLEQYVQRARHVEVQVFGDGRGRVVALGERDCSAQRRNQKVVEETPAPGLAPELRAGLADHAIRLMSAVSYRSAGTVEFLVDVDRGTCSFLEVNTRLQVEHGVTEATYGVDLVAWMVRLAAGESLPELRTPPKPRGAAIEVRLYAEDPAADFRPCAGLVTAVEWPAGVRCDTWIEAGTEVSPHYDPLLAKLVVHAEDREQAVARLAAALEVTRVDGVETNLAYLQAIVDSDVFRAGEVTTAWLSGFTPAARTVEVLEPGVFTTVQDLPGRVGYWDVGVPPSGPMDDRSFALVNRLVGNQPETPALEITLSGPTLRFPTATTIALGGARLEADLDGAAVSWWCPIEVPAGGVLRLGAVDGPGCRAYLAVAGGFDVPNYLGSRSTFVLGGFGGHGGRTLRAGDVLHLGSESTTPALGAVAAAIPAGAGEVPELTHDWTIGVLAGPHGAPDFFTDGDIEQLYAATWEVHYHSDRTGIRLIGPKPTWARPDGGEAGLHPSNIHDNAYAIGTIDFTGDMPIVLGRDGPSLGGFVCPATIATAEFWKIGQARAGDRVRFVPLDETGRRLPKPADPVLLRTEAGTDRPAVTYRRDGDRHLLVEYGPNVLDLGLRLRVGALMDRLGVGGGTAEGARSSVAGIEEVVPGIRSLQIGFDPDRLSPHRLVDLVAAADEAIGDLDELEVPSRIVHLPLSWDDPATRLATEKYMQTVRADAPWCPWNIEFIRRINGLDHVDDVHRIVHEATYLVLGLGDVYLGAPVATPIDPRHRLVTTKYNPARTWTAENSVGIGGAYLCIYGMEGPGGYQFVGRTVQVWNGWRRTAAFDRPWLLRFFDQIRWYPVEADELLRLREDLPVGRFTPTIEETTFSYGAHRRALAAAAPEIEAFTRRREAAFAEERARWEAAGLRLDVAVEAPPPPAAEPPVPAGATGLRSPLAGNVWKVLVEVGDPVVAGQPVLVVEAMKMETEVRAGGSGTVEAVLCAPGQPIQAGQLVAVVRS